MTTALVLILLAALLGIGWFVWPSVTAERARVARLREIDRLRRRTLLDMEYVAERARRERVLRSTHRLDQAIYEYDL